MEETVFLTGFLAAVMLSAVISSNMSRMLLFLIVSGWVDSSVGAVVK
jgi:hypothetical protein